LQFGKRNAMSDYIYMLESHLSPDQNRVVEDVQTAAGAVGVNLFLTGGAMRDMIAGFRIRDLDFVVEGNALKVAKALTEKGHAKSLSTDDDRKTTELVFPNGVTAQIAMSRQEKYTRTGATQSRSR
jgi:tRNA nucleotidyltransferase/poly(A) polymerase